MLSRYKLIESIGSGGVGVVWRAEDRNLRRQVAVKFLSREAFGKEHMRARFLREARVAAAINHPNICTVHEVGEAVDDDAATLDDGTEIVAGTPFLVMELVEGRSLGSILNDRGPLPLLEMLDLAVQIAEGMAEAHAHSIVHRDLKPKNVMVTAKGRVKILDFGMAKALEPPPDDEAAIQTAEHSIELTREGMVLGTVAYMSPEQATGKPVDSRSDVFSFGILLYEMAIGRKPFEGDSYTSTLAKILETEPSAITDSRADLPPACGRIVHRCLRKSPSDRYNDTRDLAVELRDLLQDSSSGAIPVTAGAAETGGRGPAVSTGSRRTARLPWMLAGLSTAVAVVAVAILALDLLQPAEPPVPPAFRQVTFSGSASQPSLSPDGRSVAFVSTRPDGRCEVVIQDLVGGQQLSIFDAAWIRSLRWSPDGSELLVAGSTTDQLNQTFLVSRLGGPTRPLRYLPFVAWSPEGDRFAGTTLSARQVWFVETATGSASSIELEGTFAFIHEIDWSPRGTLLAVRTSDESERHSIRTLSVDGKTQQSLVETTAPIYSPRFSPAGDAIYYLSGSKQAKELRKVQIDPRSGAARGEPRVLLAGLEAGQQITLSHDARKLLYARQLSHTNLWLVRRDGDRITSDQLTRGTFRHDAPRFSPDGARLAMTRRSSLHPNVFVMTLADRRPEQLTFLTDELWQPVWSSDGEEIAFGSRMGGEPRVWKVGARGGTPRPFTRTRLGRDLTWAPGPGVLYQTRGNSALHLLDAATGDESAFLDETGLGAVDPLQFFSWMASPVFAPDGDRVAFNCNCPGGEGIWIVTREGRLERRVHEGTTGRPIGWSGDGSAVYVFEPEARRVLRVPAGGGPARVHVEIPFDRVGDVDITGDGNRIAVAVPVVQEDVWLIENFDTERP